MLHNNNSNKKTLFLALVVLITMTTLVLFVPFISVAKDLEVKYPVLPGLKPLSSTTALPELITYVFSFLIFISGLIAFGAVVYAGFLYMTSGAVPAMRAEAKKRIQNVLVGLAILFSSFLILNTINPELVILSVLETGEGPQEFKQKEVLIEKEGMIDYNTIKYGGVVVFQNADVSGASGVWETILRNVGHFDNSWLGDGRTGSTQMSAVKVLGKCDVNVYKTGDADSDGTNDLNLLIKGPAAVSTLPTDNDVKILEFSSVDCLGQSVSVYKDANFNLDATPPPSTGTTDNGVQTFIHDIPNLDKVDFIDEDADVEDNITSIQFPAIEALSFTKSEAGIAGSRIKFCDRRNYETGDAGCLTLSKTIVNLGVADGIKDELSEEMRKINEKISSIAFEGKVGRQGGIILYSQPGFLTERQEILIGSVKNTSGGFVDNGGGENISAIKIIGEYKVTLYNSTNFSGTWLIISATSSPPVYQRSTVANQTPIPQRDLKGNIIEISNLDAAEYDFDDDTTRTGSIKLELPFRIVDAQKLIPATDYAAQCPDSDPTTQNPEPNDLCVI